MSLQPVDPHKFELLDGMRGTAAVFIFLHHARYLFGRHTHFYRSYLAVDFFFLLSGFVLSHAYQVRLDRGESFWKMLLLRVIRFYPLYLISLVLGCILLFSHRLALDPVPDWKTGSVILFAAFFFLPAPANRFTDRNFPLDQVVWSLSAELFVNVLHFIFGRRRSLKALVSAYVVLFVSELVFLRSAHTLDVGYLHRELFMGLLRACCGYVEGMILYRLWAHRHEGFRQHNGLQRHDPFAVSPAWAPLLLVVIMGIPVPKSLMFAYDMVAANLILPFCVLLAACSRRLPQTIRPLANVLGVSSYGVYVLHVPILRVWFSLYHLRWHTYPGTQPAWIGLIALLALIGLVALLDSFFDLPVRRALTRRLQSRYRTSAPQRAAATSPSQL